MRDFNSILSLLDPDYECDFTERPEGAGRNGHGTHLPVRDRARLIEHYRGPDLGYLLAYEHWPRRTFFGATPGYLPGRRNSRSFLRLSCAEDYFCGHGMGTRQGCEV